MVKRHNGKQIVKIQMEKYQITIKNHLRNCSTIFYGTLACISFPFLFLQFKDGDINSLSWISVIMFGVVVLPAIVIHVSYYLANKGDIIYYDFQNQQITIKHDGVVKIFNVDEIDNVKRFMSFNLAASRATVMPFDEYNHSIIYLKTGEKFTITSLIVPNLNLPIEPGKILIKESFYRFVS